MTDSSPDQRSRGVLAGLRILDAATVWAMPLAAAMLADMGAEVIKVESPDRPDMRGSEPFENNEIKDDFYNRSGAYGALNRGKKSLTLNIKKPRGMELYKQLISQSDVLFENNRPGVMKRLGLDYSVLSALNPRLIQISNSGYGQTGPWAQYGAIARGLEPTTGVSSLTGYRGGPPESAHLTDYPTAMMGVFATLAALRSRRRTGRGQRIDLCMYEIGVSLLGSTMMEYTVNGRVPARNGNRHRVFAPQGCYRCDGDDRWVVLSIRNDDEWLALCSAIGRPDLARDERFRSVSGRHEHHDAIDQIITSWTESRQPRQVMDLLQAAGIPAAAVLDPRDIYQDPQLHRRRFWQLVGDDESSVGSKPYALGGWRMSATPPRIPLPPANMGQHNTEILTSLLSVHPDEFSALEADGVIGIQPAQRGYRPRLFSTVEQVKEGRWHAHDPGFSEHLEDAFREEAAEG